MREKNIFGCLMVSIATLLIWTSSLGAVTLMPAPIHEGEITLNGGYNIYDNSKATTEDPINTLFLYGTYGVTDRFEALGLFGINQIQNVSSGTKVDSSNSYGLGLKYWMIQEQKEKAPVDISLFLHFFNYPSKYDTSGVKTDVGIQDIDYGITVSHIYPMENWPKQFIPYASFSFRNRYASVSGGATATLTEALRDYDVGIRAEVQKDWWLFGEWNLETGYINSNKDATATFLSFGVSYSGIDLGNKKGSASKPAAEGKKGTLKKKGSY